VRAWHPRLLRRAASLTGRPEAKPAEAPEDGRRAAREVEMERLRTALAGLPRDRRTILAWFYLEERSVREIAEVLAIPEGTVKSRLYHARAALRASIEEES